MRVWEVDTVVYCCEGWLGTNFLESSLGNIYIYISMFKVQPFDPVTWLVEIARYIFSKVCQGSCASVIIVALLIILKTQTSEILWELLIIACIHVPAKKTEWVAIVGFSVGRPSRFFKWQS